MTGHNATPRHPSVLHALTAAWSLQVARRQLDLAAQYEVADQSDGFRSCSGGTLRSRGGHGDPVGTAALRTALPAGTGRLATLAASTTNTLTWLADTLNLVAGPDPLWRILDGLLQIQPGTAEQLRRWLADHDTRIRTALALGADEQTLPGAECPACGRRPLYARTAAPDPADWTVVCGEGCRCSGYGCGCGCGMPIRVEGVGHVWTRATPAVAAMLDRVMMDGQRTEGVAA